MSLKPKKRKQKRKGTMFGDTPASQELAHIITIRSPREADKAINTLRMMHEGGTRKEQVHIERAMTLASNRAKAFLNSPEISPKKREEMKSVARKYKTAQEKFRARRIKHERESFSETDMFAEMSAEYDPMSESAKEIERNKGFGRQPQYWERGGSPSEG